MPKGAEIHELETLFADGGPRSAIQKKPTSFHNEAGIINKPKKVHYKSM